MGIDRKSDSLPQTKPDNLSVPLTTRLWSRRRMLAPLTTAGLGVIYLSFPRGLRASVQVKPPTFELISPVSARNNLVTPPQEDDQSLVLELQYEDESTLDPEVIIIPDAETIGGRVIKIPESIAQTITIPKEGLSSVSYAFNGWFVSGGKTVKEVISCGSAKNPANGCGHGGLNYHKLVPSDCGKYYACQWIDGKPYYTARLLASVDIKPSGIYNPVGYELRFPALVDKTGNDVPINYRLLNGPRYIGTNNKVPEWGWKYIYLAQIPDGRVLLFHLGHVNKNADIPLSAKSGDFFSKLYRFTDGSSAHLHLTIGTVMVDKLRDSNDLYRLNHQVALDRIEESTVYLEPSSMGVGR